MLHYTKPAMLVFVRRAFLVLLVLGLGGLALFVPYHQGPKVTLHGTVLKNPKPAPDFTLYTAGNRPFSMHELRGKVVLLFFGYTRCPDVCPLTLMKLAQVYKALGRPEDLQVVMVSIDPERDDPDAADRYAKLFDKSFIGLSGPPEAIAQVAAKYYIHVAKEPNGLVDHTATVTLIDAKGLIRIYYGQKDVDDVETLKGDLEYILAQGGSF